LTRWKAIALFLGLHSGVAISAGPVLVVFPEGTNTLALQTELEDLLSEKGLALGRVLTPAQLGNGLKLESVRTGVVDVACLDRVDILEWKSTLQRAEMAVQIFRPKQAVELTRQLEDQLVCLDGVPSRKSLRTLYLTRALALNLEGGGNYALTEVVDQVVSLGSDLPEPVGLPPELQTRWRQAGERDKVRVFGGGTQGELFIDGERLSQGSRTRGAGLHLVQLVDRNGRVSTGLLMPFRGGKTLLWAGELPDRPVQAAVQRLVSSQRSSTLLRAISAVHRRTIIVGARKAGRLVLYHVDGRILAQQLPGKTKRQVAESPSAGAARSVVAVQSNLTKRVQPEPTGWFWSAGSAVAMTRRSGETAAVPGAGVAFWARAWAPIPLSFSLSAAWIVSPELLPPEQSDFYALHKALQIRSGVVLRGDPDRSHGEIGVHGRFATGSSQSTSPWAAGASLGFFAPVWERASWRLQVRAERGSGVWESAFQLGVEWGP
jgi:hypothetical protein